MIGARTGVDSIKVSLADKEAVITYNPTLVSPKELSEAIYDMGFDTKVTQVDGKPYVPETNVNTSAGKCVVEQKARRWGDLLDVKDFNFSMFANSF